MPKPTIPLRKNIHNAGPVNPCPKTFARTARNKAAKRIRQKFASVPPRIREVRLAQMADTEKNTVVMRAANTVQDIHVVPIRTVQTMKENVSWITEAVTSPRR